MRILVLVYAASMVLAAFIQKKQSTDTFEYQPSEIQSSVNHLESLRQQFFDLSLNESYSHSPESFQKMFFDLEAFYGENHIPVCRKSDYKVSRDLLGQGSFGAVVLVERLSDGKEMVLKMFADPYAYMQEKKIAFKMKGAIFAPSTECFSDEEKFLIFEYFNEGSLADVISDHAESLALDSLRHLIAKLVLAVEEIGKRNLVHMDIKLDNIVKSLNRIALIDFNLSNDLDDRDLDEPYFIVGGTRMYMSPEIGKNISLKLFSSFIL
jgi:hypothetical protein